LKTVWYVDDDKNRLQAMHLMLKLLEHEMRPFSSTHNAAQALLAGEQPDIVILDVAMPEVSGIGLLEFIRQKGTWNQLPIIVLASKQDEDLVQKAISMGADGYVIKPIMLDELENTMQTTIEKRKQP
jgi:DNA-binding response OmpR family regulator